MRGRMVQGVFLSLVIIAFTCSSWAATYNAGTFGLGDTFADLFQVAQGPFADTINFVIDGGNDFSGAAQNVTLTLDVGVFSPNPIFDIEGIWMEIRDSGDNLKGSGLQFNATLPNGDYYAMVTGKGTGSSGGAYALVMASVIPIPASILILGSGLAGLMVIRRKFQG